MIKDNNMTDKANIKKNKEGYKLVFNGLTPGEILSLYNALAQYSNSPVAQDVKSYLNNAMSQCDDSMISRLADHVVK